MAAKRPRRKATLHSAGKIREADLLERARALADDPSLATPLCEGSCVWFSPVAAARRAIPKVHAVRDDEKKLTRFASSGNELSRAYAATLLLAKQGRIPFVAELKLPTGPVPYVIRGNAKPFQLAGLQNHHDRALRLLAYMPWAKKRRLHFFSADRGVICTGRSAKPPADFVEEEMDELNLVEQKERHYVCVHGGAGAERAAITLDWRAAGVTLERCSECAGTDSTLMTLMRHMIGPGLSQGFDVGARLPPIRTQAGAPLQAPSELPDEVKRAYTSGRLSDAAILMAAQVARAQALSKLPGPVFVAGETAYDNVDAFLAALRASEAEERALRTALAARTGPVVVERASAARAIHALWADQGLLMLESVAGDAELAKRLHRAEVTPDEASELVRKAAREGGAKAALTALPRYQGLPPGAAAADAIARAFRANGASAAGRVALERAAVAKAKGVCLAFLQAVGLAKGNEWRFGGGDQEMAEALQPLVRTLLEGPVAEYHETLRAISTRAGETVPFQPL